QTKFLFVIRTRSAATSHYSVASGAKRTTFCSMGVLRILAEGEITGCPLARQLSGVKLSRCPGLSLSGLAQSGHAIRAAECLLSRAGRNLTNFRVPAPANGRRTAPSHVHPRHLARGIACAGGGADRTDGVDPLQIVGRQRDVERGEVVVE